VQIAPNGNTTNPTPVYTWYVAAGATSYWVEVANATGYVFRGGYAASQICSGSLCGIQSPLLAVDSYAWYVQAQNGPLKTWSDGMAFTIQPLPAPAALSPNGPMTAFTPTYKWSPSVGATQYFLQVKDSNNVNTFQSFYTASAICSDAGCAVTPSLVLTAGSYTWAVQAKNQSSGGTWSAEKAFTVFGCAGEVKTGDFNGDGRTDRLCSGEGGVVVSLATATGFATGVVWLAQPIANPLVGDFDGDGRSDVAWFDSATGTFSVALSGGASFGALQSWGTATAGSTCLGPGAAADIGTSTATAART
jgi:hypothetical protein